MGFSQTEVELNEKLYDTLQKLQQAGAEKQETEKEAKFKETLASLKRAFPGEPQVRQDAVAKADIQSRLSIKAFAVASSTCAGRLRRNTNSLSRQFSVDTLIRLLSIPRKRLSTV